jgi:hypothetical protein
MLDNTNFNCLLTSVDRPEIRYRTTMYSLREVWAAKGLYSPDVIDNNIIPRLIETGSSTDDDEWNVVILPAERCVAL